MNFSPQKDVIPAKAGTQRPPVMKVGHDRLSAN
jgi:hypothetical protein